MRLFPDLLGTYGDDGNALVLARRAGWRGVEARIIDVTADVAIPDDGHVYLIGGGEDGPQTRAAALLAESGALLRAIEGGAALLAICAGFQIMGASFVGPNGSASVGLGLLDVETVRGTGPRIVGEVVVDTDPELGIGPLTGYENHAGVTVLGASARPLGQVRVGMGNRAGDAVEGVWDGRIIATYLHGPALAGTLRSLIFCWPGHWTSSRTSSSRSTTSGSRPSGPNGFTSRHESVPRARRTPGGWSAIRSRIGGRLRPRRTPG